MVYELALYVGDAAKLRAIQRALSELAARGRPIRARELLRGVSGHIGPGLQAPFIHLLLNQRVAQTVEAAPAVEDYVIEVDAKAVSRYFEAQIQAAEVVKEVEARQGARDARQSVVGVVATVPPQLLVGTETTGINAIDPAIKRVLASARETAWVVNPFFDPFGMASLLPALVGAARRGAHLRIMTRDAQRPRPLLKSAVGLLFTEFRKQRLLDSAEIRDLYKRDPETGRAVYALHSKIVLADMRHCYIGSANVTESSLRHNFELGVVLTGPVVQSVAALLDGLWRESDPVDWEIFWP